MSASVRVAGPDDLDAVTALFVGYLDFYRVDAEPGRARAFMAERLVASDGVVLLAESDGRAVGLAQCYRTWSSLSMSRAWVLNDLFVAPDARGTGAGRALLREVQARAAADGASYVALETARDNHRARTLYESEGFVVDDEYLHLAAPVTARDSA